MGKSREPVDWEKPLKYFLNLITLLISFSVF